MNGTRLGGGELRLMKGVHVARGSNGRISRTGIDIYKGFIIWAHFAQDLPSIFANSPCLRIL